MQVDQKIDKYVQICQTFESMKDNFCKTEQYYLQLKQIINQSKDTCEKSINQVNERIDDYNSKYHQEVGKKHFLKVVTQLQKLEKLLQDIASKPALLQGHKIYLCCQTYMKCQQKLQQQTEADLKVREIAANYQLAENLAAKFNQLVKYTEQRLILDLTRFSEKFGSLDPPAVASLQRNWVVCLNALHILRQNKIMEKVIFDNILKPFINAIFDELNQSKSFIISATKQEFLDKSSKLKQAPIQQFSDQVVAFCQGKFRPLIDICRFQPAASPLQSSTLCYDPVDMLWEQLANQLRLKQYNFLYSVGLPDMFHLNYVTVKQLIRFLRDT